MADHNDGLDSCNLEISICPEPHLEATQDLELLAQEIAEAAVDDEKRSSPTPSPTPVQHHREEAAGKESADKDKIDDDDQAPRDDDGDDSVKGEDEDDSVQAEGEKEEKKRSHSPVDEASWVLVDAEDDENSQLKEGESGRESPEKKFSVFRKFLARGDLRQKLADIGLTSDNSNDAQAVDDKGSDEPQGVTLKDLVMSCSESMVICDLPQEGEHEVGGEDLACQLFLKDPPECPKLSGWQGTFSGAKVTVEVERQGGLLVAGVKVWHVDLLSALASLQNLVTSTGLVSYADVDVPSLLARAA
ncbi:uncharacterized protein [Panulirus ornatus]|uniref:uncharacterized protein n=1 Tax=Panulirus ornatus TaxID=150431 RepID=UPI003A88DF65